MARVRTNRQKGPWQRRLETMLRLIVIVLTGSILAVAGWDLYRFLFISDFFIISQVDIEGCDKTSPGEFLSLADVQPGTNIFRCKTGQIQDRLRRHPWVEDVRIARVLPSQLQIVIKERVPLAAINSTFDGQIYGLDRHLVLLPEPETAAGVEHAAAPPCFDLPIITGLPPQDIFPGNRLSTLVAERLVNTLVALRTLNSSLLENLSEINVDPEGNLTLYPVERTQAIYLGRENLQQRTYRLCQVWNYLQENKIDSGYIDCRFDSQGVVTRPENLTAQKWNSLPPKGRNLVVAEAFEGAWGGNRP